VYLPQILVGWDENRGNFAIWVVVIAREKLCNPMPDAA
jgi:hypothetical protein